MPLADDDQLLLGRKEHIGQVHVVEALGVGAAGFGHLGYVLGREAELGRKLHVAGAIEVELHHFQAIVFAGSVVGAQRGGVQAAVAEHRELRVAHRHGLAAKHAAHRHAQYLDFGGSPGRVAAHRQLLHALADERDVLRTVVGHVHGRREKIAQRPEIVVFLFNLIAALVE